MFISLFKSNIEVVYNRIDEIVLKNKIGKRTVPHELKKNAVFLSFQEMMQDRIFSICSVRNIYAMLGVDMSTERERFYKALHCVCWGDMDEKTKESLIAMIFDDIRVPMTTVESEVKDLTPELYG